MAGSRTTTGYILTDVRPYETKQEIMFNLPHGAKVEIEKTKESKKAYLCCEIYKNPKVLLQEYSNEFTNEDIYKDCADKVASIMGFHIYPVYSF